MKDDLSDLLTLGPADPVDQPITIVRVRTSVFRIERGMSIRKDLTTRTLCRPRGHDWLADEMDAVGAENLEIKNLATVPDGLYILTICDVHRDWESGVIDDYSLRLVPYKAKQS